MIPSTTRTRAVAFLLSLFPVLGWTVEASATSVDLLRAAGEFEAAARVARDSLLALRSRADADLYDLHVAEISVKALEDVCGLDAASRAELARAERLGAEARDALESGEPEHGEVLLREVLAIRAKHLGDADWVALTWMELAEALRQQRRLSARERAVRAAIETWRASLGEHNVRIADARALLGWALLHMGEDVAAEEQLREAVALYREILGPHHIREIDPVNNLSIMYRWNQEMEKALPLAKECYEIASVALGPNHPKTLTYKLNFGIVLVEMGRPAEGERIYAEVEKVARQLEREKPDVYAGVVVTAIDYRADAEYRLGKFEASEMSLQEAVQRLVSKVGNIGGALVFNLRRMAWCRAALGDLEGAAEYYRRAAEVFEPTRTRIDPGIRRATFRRSPYQGLAIAQLELGREADAWGSVERTRGRVLADMLLPDQPLPVPLPRIQAQLQPNTAIVGWLDYRLRRGEASFWGYVIRDTGDVAWERLAVPDGMSESDLVEDLQKFVDEHGETLASPLLATEFDREHARRLYDNRLEPLERHLGGVDALVVVPSLAMSGVPLGSFVDSRGRFLAERFAIRYTPSSSIWAHWNEVHRGRRIARALLLGDPPFREEDSKDEPPAKGDSWTVATLRDALAGDMDALRSLPRLAASRDEVSAIAQQFPDAVVLVGNDASELRVAEQVSSVGSGGFDVIHLATHALIDDRAPERSALVLSQVGTESSDGLLQATEIETWSIEAELVTLSACRTAVGRRIWGEGNVSIAYPFLMAGARSVLVSLWRVDDRATSLLMQRFYSNWLGDNVAGAVEERMPKAQALQEAQQWLRTLRSSAGTQPYAHPAYWSAFILVGD